MTRKRVRTVDQIHELKREIKQLNETIRKLERAANNEAKKEKKADKDKPKEIEKDPAACPDCSKGKIEVIDLNFRKMLVCSLSCGYRKVIKNG